MKVLVISHNVFSKTVNMGKTLSNIFSEFDTNDIIQLYFHSEVPTVENVCSAYYRFTDIDAIKSILLRNRCGKIFSNKDVHTELATSRVDKGSISNIYQRGRSRTPLIYLMRDLLWTISGWFNKNLKEWLDKEKPDVIFLASGDYSFIYKIANKISKYLDIPMFVYCVDDFYLYNANGNKFLSKFRHKLYMNIVNKTMKNAETIINICPKMATDYSKLFNKRCVVLNTSADSKTIEFDKNANKFAYFGSLSFGRAKQLAEIGKTVCEISKITGLENIDVYSFDKNENSRKLLEKTKGVQLHDGVSEAEMLNILKSCIGVIHVESFDEEIKQRIRYSVSTKIPESLMYGPCLFAYGPSDIASIEYIKENQAAYVVDSKLKLEKGLEEFILNSSKRNEIISNARKVANLNHNLILNSMKLQNLFEETLIEK